MEVGTNLRNELLFELLLVREQDTSDCDQVKCGPSRETVILRVVWFAVFDAQHMDVTTSTDGGMVVRGQSSLT